MTSALEGIVVVDTSATHGRDDGVELPGRLRCRRRPRRAAGGQPAAGAAGVAVLGARQAQRRARPDHAAGRDELAALGRGAPTS